MLVDLLQEGAGRQAAALLEEERALAWIRDDESGGFPIHIACWKVCAGAADVRTRLCVPWLSAALEACTCGSPSYQGCCSLLRFLQVLRT